MNQDPEEILSFWFGETSASPDELIARSKLWFLSDPDFDESIRSRFGGLPEIASQGRLDGWRDEPRSCLALVLILDQFPRNLFRGSARAFGYDAQARMVANLAIGNGFDGDLDPLEAIFLYLPLEHSESLADQERSVVLFECLQARAEPARASIFATCADYAKQHRDVILRFGRFPHRNSVLGRKEKRAEQSFLSRGGASF
jgi:uncharacterized protein (DUF924 family)